MIKTRMQLNALIRNKAAGDGDKAQILLRIYMMERLLERISVSGYRDNFILKGGMLVSSLVGVDMRTTMDIDTTVRAIPLTQEKAKEFLKEIMAIDLEDNVSFRITKVEDIMEGHEYEGIRFHIEGNLEKLCQTIKIDVSTGDAITPAAVEYELPLILENRKIGLWAYNVETLLAEKLETVMTRAEANTRMRDFYDVYILTRQETIEINSAHLKEAFEATCRKRGSEALIPSFDEVLESIEVYPSLFLFSGKRY
ncbi:MAG: nucleotidyl transferase AbiEii/AbiGii toxin family protein [Eubacterium sp.]|nr:nucleotidyl transferase AbiEii/AbiGii toxin family protein [Eubacterium sp.]